MLKLNIFEVHKLWLLFGNKVKHIFMHFYYFPPCNTENPAKWLFVTPYKSTLNQLVEEVVVTATL